MSPMDETEQMQQQMPPEEQMPSGEIPQMEEPVDPRQLETFETILAGLLEFVFGPGKKGIAKQLKGAKNLGQTIGNITFTLLKEAASQAKEAQQSLDMEVMFGVATELIDSLIRFAGSLGQKVNPDQLREEGLMTALQAYIMTLEQNPEEQEIAKQMLAEMVQDGTAEEAAMTIDAITERVSGEPKKNPMAQGVSAGLMGA